MQLFFGFVRRYNFLSMQVLEDGGYAISDRIDITGEGTDNFIFGHGWLLEIITLTGGDYYFHQRRRGS